MSTVKNVTVKSVLGDDIRRFVIASDSSFEDFAAQIRQAYGLKEKFTVRFLDDEQELITVTTDAGLREALSLAISGFVKILKFQIQTVPAVPVVKTEAKAPTNLQPTAPPFTPPAAVPQPPSQVPRAQAQASPQGPQPRQIPSGTPPSKMQIIEALKEVVMDREVSRVLPDAWQVLLSGLTQPNSPLQDVVDHVLGAFPMIRNHPSMTTLMPWLPYFLSKLEPMRQTFLNPATLSMFGSQMLSRLPHFLEMFDAPESAGSFFAGHEHNPWSEEHQADQEGDEEASEASTPPFMCDGRFPPPFPGGPDVPFPGGHGVPNDVHRGVTCDNCGVRPIRGLRYKCSVCPNFDLCSKCEAQDSHQVDHPLIKMRPPVSPPPGFPPHHHPGMAPHPHPFAPHFGGFWGMPPPGGVDAAAGFRGRWPGFRGGGRGRCMKKWACGTPSLERSNSGCGAGRPNWREPNLQATFLRECNLQDRTEVSASQTLVKTWELQNSGATAWPAGTKLAYARGDLPCIENSFDVAGPVEPGKTVQVSAVVRTPAMPGRYRAFFKLEDNQGNKFGPRLWCDVTVVAANSPSEVPKPESPESAVLDAAQYLFRAEAREAAEVKARATAAFWEREQAREAKEKEEQRRREAECVVVHAPKDGEESPKPAPAGENAGQHKYQEQLNALKSMGWGNEELNVSLLEQHQGNVQAVCSWLLEQQGQS